MEKKSTVRPIFLTESQLALIKKLIAPSVDYDGTGYLALYSENPLTRDACQIQRQIELAEFNDTQAIWLTRYDLSEEYGGPEEGGWSYTQRDVYWTEAYTCTAELVRNFNEQLVNLYDEAHCEANIADDYITSQYLNSRIADSATSTLNCIHEVTIPIDRDTAIELAIEFTPGASVTMSKPIWE